LLRRASVLAVLLSTSLPLHAQSLDQASARERERRATAVARPSRVFTDEDLQRYVEQRLPEVAIQLPSGGQPAPLDSVAHGEAPRQDAYGRHRASAEAYLRQCEERLRAAKEIWLPATEAIPLVVAKARRALESAAGALERARTYRDQAVLAARLAGAATPGPR
jgi:hypothetical protein